MSANRRKKFGVLKGLNLIIVVFSLLAYATGYFNPDFYWLVYFGLAGFWLFCANIAFVLIWAFLGRRWFLLSLLFLVATWGAQSAFFQIGSKKSVDSSGLKVISANVALFGAEVNKNKESMLAFCKMENPDIVCFQEFQSNPRGYNDINDKFFAELGFKAGYFERTIYHNKHIQSGICIYSKYPIIKRGFFQFDQKRSVNACIWIDVDRGSDTLRVFNIHLQSVRLNPGHYSYLGDLEVSGSEKAEGIREILGKLKRGVLKRTGQADIVKKEIQNSPYPVILCGDFNAPPTSYAYKTISGQLEDSFLEAGRGTGYTYAGPLPFYRIDYIMASKNLKVLSHDVAREQKSSDHYPIVAVFDL